MDSTSPTKNPKDPDLLGPLSLQVIGSKSPQKTAERARIVKKLLTPKKGTHRWKNKARTDTMLIMPTQTTRAKRIRVEEGEEDGKSYKKSCVAKGDEQNPPSVSAFRLRGGDVATDPLVVAANPTGHNENLMLEHLGAWEP